MQQVAARNCLHGAASGARAGVSVLEELFWNAAARSDAICSEFGCRGMHLHADCARAAARKRRIGLRGVWYMVGRSNAQRLYARSDPRG